MSKAAELASLIGNINAGGGDNFIINGGMTVSQRGTSFTNPSSNAYCLDRYAIQWAGISPQFTVSQDTSTPDGEGFYKSLKIATSNTQTPSSGQGAYMYQKVEGNSISSVMLGTSNAKRLVLSFYVKSSKTGTYSVGFHNNGFDRNLVSEYTISSANTWEKKTIRFVGDTSGTWTTDTSIGIGVYFHLSNGDGSNTTSTLDSWQSGNNYLGSQNQVNLWDSSSATWQITGVQLEIGQNPTEFEHEKFSQTLEKCSRYYQKTKAASDTYKHFGLWFCAADTGGGGTGYGTVAVPLVTTMRTVPSLETTGTVSNYAIVAKNTNYALTTFSVDTGIDDGTINGQFYLNAYSGGGMGVGTAGAVRANNTADAFVALDAEL